MFTIRFSKEKVCVSWIISHHQSTTRDFNLAAGAFGMSKGKSDELENSILLNFRIVWHGIWNKNKSPNRQNRVYRVTGTIKFIWCRLIPAILSIIVAERYCTSSQIYVLAMLKTFKCEVRLTTELHFRRLLVFKSQTHFWQFQPHIFNRKDANLVS